MAERLKNSKAQSHSQRLHRVLLSAVLSLAALALLALLATDAHAQTAIAHWSFDTPTLTVSSGNITAVDDVAGAHDATVSPTGVGNAPPSAPFPTATDSVAGQFGQGLRFNGNNYMTFPNLTELMQSAGAPSYSVSMWLRWLSPTAPIGNTVYRTMSSWGNGPNGTPNETARFSYGFGINGPSALRGQTRHESASQAGTDIYARTSPVATPVNNGEWHMLTWTFDTTLGALNVYYDGAFVETFPSTAASFQMADSTSPIGTFGLKGDDSTFQTADTQMDEVWVFNSVLADNQVETLFLQNGFGPPPVLGDTDGDGIVELEDFDPIRDNFRKNVTMRNQGDLVRNNFVDFHDFRQWKTAFLALGGSLADVDLGFLSSVPEPSSGLAMLIGSAIMLIPSRKRMERQVR